MPEKKFKQLKGMSVAFIAITLITALVNFAHADTDVVSVYGIHEPPKLEKMLDQMQNYVFFTVGSYYSGALSAETGHISFRMPYAFELVGLRASTTSAPAADMVIDVNEAGTTVLSTKLYIQNGSTTSTDAYTSTAATGSNYVISDSEISDNALITVDIDSTTGGHAPKITFYGRIKSIPSNY